MSQPLAGKTVVVTGASEGIGKACAEAYVGAGAQVVAISRSIDKLNAAFAAHHGKVIPMPLDLLDEEARAELVDRVLKEVEKIDIFHANAGMYVGGDLVENDPEAITRATIMNVIIPQENVRRVLPHMIENGGGKILITSSLAAPLETDWEPVYASNKAGISKFARLVHDQVSDAGVTVSTISPGPVRTELFEQWEEKDKKNALALGIMEPQDVADAALFMMTLPERAHIQDLHMKPPKFSVAKVLNQRATGELMEQLGPQAEAMLRAAQEGMTMTYTK
ncbi:MAG: SDR family NAD(P)-dependent oxidoreductase [Pseudomonadota bacterium]